MSATTQTNSRSQRAAAGFTVVEMMIVVGLIAILIALVIVSMQHVRTSANRTETANALRQMVGGYNAYMTDHRQRFMPGFLGESAEPGIDHYVQHLRINAPRPGGEPFITDFSEGTSDQPYDDLGSYVWRLAPYLDFGWALYMTDYRANATLSRLQNDLTGSNPDNFVYGPATFGGSYDEASTRTIAMAPSIGLNSIFLGGDTRHGGTYATERHPWHPDVVSDAKEKKEKLAATRYTEVRNPSQLIVFAPTGRANTAFGQDEPEYITPEWTEHEIGYVELRPPFVEQDISGVWIQRQWEVGPQKSVVRTATVEFYEDGAGLPICRWGAGYLPVGNLDGSTAVEDIGPLSIDMRRWSPFETGMEVPPFEP